MVLPQGVLRAATNRPVLVELKNGDSYHGTLAAADNLMNLRLENVIFTPCTEHKTEKHAECIIRGNYVKFVRFPDSLIDEVAADEVMSQSGSKGRGKKSKGSKGGDKTSRPTLVKVPASMVGSLIGKRGETIKRITDESGANVEVAKEQFDSLDERNVYLSGSQEAVDCAKALIEKLIQDKSQSRDRPQRDKGYVKGYGKGTPMPPNQSAPGLPLQPPPLPPGPLPPGLLQGPFGAAPPPGPQPGLPGLGQMMVPPLPAGPYGSGLGPPGPLRPPGPPEPSEQTQQRRP